MKAKITLLLLFLLGCVNVNAQSFLVSFPNHATAPVQNPRNLTVCNSSSSMQVRLDVATASTTGANVTIQLPPGIEYLPGTILKTSGTAALVITDNGGTANAPQFKLGPSTLTAGDYIVFTIDRKATCDARTSAISGTAFKDVVTGTITGQTASSGTSSPYQISYPVFAFTQPATQNNAVIGQTYSRTFTITNGGNGCTNEVYFSIDYPSNGIKQTSLTLGGVAITPTSTVGTTSYYTIDASKLPGGDFCFGESLTFTETYIVKACNGATNYAAGWGCGATPAAWCQTVSGSGGVTMKDGSASLASFTVAKLNYVNDCTPFQYTFKFVTAGANTSNASAMFDAIFRVGGSSSTVMGNAQILFNDLFKLSNLNYNGKSIPVVYASPGNHLRIVVKDYFTSDPDGAGVGFEDLDGDGFFDDLLPNSTITFTTDVNVVLTKTCPISLSGYWGYKGDVMYANMCKDAKATSISQDTHRGLEANTLASTTVSEILQQADNSYSPANVYGGVPFRMRFAESWYSMGTMNYNPKQRYEWQVVLPVGVDVSGTGNVLWANGKDVAVTPNVTPTYSFNPTTRVLTVLSPGVDMGMFYLDLVYNCATGGSGVVNIPYTIHYINDYSANCRTYSPMFCGTTQLANVMCTAVCPDGGVSASFVKVEREDNSLGWTNSSLTTHQLRANISSSDLSKALYLDDFFIQANGVQQTFTSDNLYLRTTIKKLVSQTADIISIKTMDVVIKRGATTVSSGVLSSSFASGTGSSNTIQSITWNLTSLIPSGGMLPGDIIETKSHYSVIAGDGKLPTTDIQTGESLKMYNLVAGVEKSCNALVPEMYLVGTIYNYYPPSGSTVNGCSQFGFSLSAYRNFAAAGNKYINEYRPAFSYTGLDITLPVSLTLVSYGTLTPTSVTPVAGGTLYHFDYPSERRTEIFTGLGNNGITGSLVIAGSCNLEATNAIQFKAYGQDYLYHYKDLAGTNIHTNSFVNGTATATSDTVLKAAISISNQTGTIQASKPTESAIVRISSTGGSTAPYIWLKVPTQSGVTVAQVVNVASGIISTPISYSGGVWFQISNAGIAPGNNADYRLDFTYTTCTASAIHVEAGWNCTGYPVTPDQYICTPVAVDLPFIPQTAEVQIITVKQPTAPIDLCTAIPFEYRMNSAGAGNTVNNKFVIDLPAGMFYESGSIQAEYPANSGNWSPVSFTTVGTRTTVNLTSHPNFPVQGLPGTLNDGGNNNLRLIGLRFSLNTNCDFVAGSNINILANANRSCGAAATGDGVGSASLSINAKGVVPGYFVVSNLAPTSGSFNNCNSPVVFSASHTIVSSVPTGSTGSAHIILPPGYGYVANSFACIGSPCATFKGIATNGSGQSYIDLGIPAGMNSGDKLNYTFAVENTSHVACSNYRVILQTVDDIAGVGCSSAPGGVCSNIAIQTGSTSYEYTISNPTLGISSFKGTYNAGNYLGSISVNNTSALNQTNASPANPVKIGFYCADASGNPTGSLLGSYTMTGSIAAGATVTENYTLSGASACGLGKIVAVISTDNNCICETVTKTLDLLPVATNDSNCYTQGATSTVINVLANDTTGDSIVPTSVSLIAPSGATGIITDANGDIVSMTIALEGTWSVNITTGDITFVPVSNTVINPTAIQYTGRDLQGNVSTVATVTAKTSVEKVGTESTTCAANGLGYTLNLQVKGLAPYTVTGTGAPGTWSGNIWTSGSIATGTNYNVSIQDTNACNSLVVSGTAPVCCLFEVTNPTFATTIIACYAQLPTATTLTKTEFEVLGNANGFIGTNPCGVIVITASNGPNPVCNGNVIRTYTVTEYVDTNNNKVRDTGENTILNIKNVTQTFTIDQADFTMPANQSSTVACASAIVAPTVPVVKDNCGNTLTASVPVISATPTCEGDVTYTYTFKDCEGNTHNWVYTYTIENADFVMPANEGSTVACASAIVGPTVPVVKDNCGNTLTASTPVISATPICEGDVTYTYTFKDCEGNTHNWVYTYTIESADFVMPANEGSTVACASAIVAPTVPVVKDNCGNTLTASAPVISVTPTCEGDVTYTYTFTDCEGNTHNWVYTYIIESADFAMPANQSSTVACASAIVAPTVPVVKDNCGNTLTASAPVISATPTCEGDVTYTYTFTDCEGNTHNWVYTYTIESADFAMPANQSSTVVCASAIVAPTVPVVKDNCGNTLTASAPVISATPTCEGDVTYTYTFKDCEGNTHNWIYTYTIESADFVMPANQGSTVACASAIVAPTVPVVKDNCGNILTASAPVISAIPTCEGDVTYTYTFTDCEGNTHNWVYTYTIESADFVMPANVGSTVACASAIVAPTVPVVKNNCGNTLTASAPVISATPTCEGDVTYTYTFKDCEGNIHNWVYTYTIDDTIAPTGTAPADVTLECISEIPVADVNLITDEADNCNGTVTVTVADTNNGGSGAINKPYIVTRTYTLTDCSGLTTNLVQTITVKDTQAPQTPVLADVTVGECNGTPVAPTTTDTCSGTITGTTTTVFPITKQGTTVVTWTFDDGHGNKNTANQNVIVKDTKAPVIPVLADVTVGECSGSPVAPTTNDTCSGTITGTTTTVFPITKQGTTVVTWTFDDGNGNISKANQNVIVKDSTAPVAPTLADVTLEGCSGTPEIPTAKDACSGTIIGTTTTVFPLVKQGTTVVIWTFDDKNGNVTTVSQNVIMKNTIVAPVSKGDQTACAANQVQTLTATASSPEGTKVVWYNSATAGSIVSSPTLNAVGTITYYAATVNTITGCSSLTRTPVTLTLYNCSIGIIKTVVFDDNNGDGFAQAGETLSYSFEIENLGNVPLTNVSVSDIKEGLILNGDPINLAVGETNTRGFSGIYKLTQSDINLGKVSNQATVTGTTPLNTIVTDISDDSSFLEDKPTVLDVKGCVIEVFNAVSPNEDGKNDAFYIRGLECYIDNTVEIYNRWGVLVFERDHYNNVDRVFKGISEGRTTINQSSELPAGTYFYILKYKDSDNGMHEKSGYLYITR